MRREVAGPEHTGDHALCVTVCNVEVLSIITSVIGFTMLQIQRKSIRARIQEGSGI